MKLSDGIRKIQRKFCSAVIVGGGSASRFGEDKLMLELEKIPVLIRAIQPFQNSGSIDEIVVVTAREKLEDVSRLCRLYRLDKVARVVGGGANRTESALAGVSETSKKAKIICIHDGARPLTTEEIIDSTVRAAAQYRSAAPVVGVTDTIRIGREGSYDCPARDTVFAMQTPQAFDADLIKGALTAAVAGHKSYTDDCAAVEAMGVSPHLTEGIPENIKITVPADLELAAYYIKVRRDGA